MRPTDPLQHPADWATRTIGSAIELRRGLAWSKDQEHPAPREGAVPVLRITNVQDRLDTTDLLYLSGVPDHARAKKRASKGWCILVGSNGNRNRIGNAVYQEIDTDFMFASFLLAARPKESSGLLPEFFFRWLQSEGVQARLSATAEGSTGLSNLAHDFFKAMKIAVPPPKEQEAIARILDAADAAIDASRATLDRSRRLQRGILQHFLDAGLGRITSADRPGRNLAPGWRLERCQTLLVGEPKNGLSPRTESQPPGFPTFSIAAVRGGKIDLSGEHLKYARIRKEAAAQARVHRGDILVVRGNANPDLVGKCGMISDHPIDCIYPDILKRVRFRNDNDGLLPEYVVLAWNHPVVHNQVLKRAQTSNGTLKINSRDVKQMVLPVPPLCEQTRLVELDVAAARRVEALEQQVVALQRLKQGLMQDLLTGRVRVGAVGSPVPSRGVGTERVALGGAR